MDIKTQDSYGNEVEISISEFVEMELFEDREGELESLSASVNKIHNFLGVLCERLIKNHIFSPEELSES